MDRFMLAMPFDLVKAGADGEMRIGGYASTEDRDRQGEIVMQKTLDISEFVKSGFFNLDHDNSKILGYPDAGRCRIDGHGLYVEGILLKGVPEAESIYCTAVALQKSNAPRRLGFSIEGKILERQGDGRVSKAKVYNVAVTSTPVNTNCTWDALCKSFMHGPAKADAPDTYAKSEEAGPLAATGNGEVLIPESLETAFRNLAHIIGHDDEALKQLEALKETLRGSKPLTKSEAALYLTLTRGLPLQKSLAIVQKIYDEEEVA